MLQDSCFHLLCSLKRVGMSTTGGSGMISSIISSSSSDLAVIFSASAALEEKDASRQSMDAQPSGDHRVLRD